MANINKMAIAWSIGIVVAFVAVASVGSQFMSAPNTEEFVANIEVPESLQPSQSATPESSSEGAVGESNIRPNESAEVESEVITEELGPQDKTNDSLIIPEKQQQNITDSGQNDTKKESSDSESTSSEQTTKTPQDMTEQESTQSKESTAGSAKSSTSVSIPAGTSTPGCEETDECYAPSSVTVSSGETVMWTNDDSAAHTVTAGTASDGPSGQFDSGLISAGQTFSHTFESSGNYDYFCRVHPWMTGTVNVKK